MRESEKRSFKDTALIQDYLKKARHDIRKKNVTFYEGEDGSSIIRIKNDVSGVTRKEHTFPEYRRKDGD